MPPKVNHPSKFLRKEHLKSVMGGAFSRVNTVGCNRQVAELLQCWQKNEVESPVCKEPFMLLMHCTKVNNVREERLRYAVERKKVLNSLMKMVRAYVPPA